MKILQEAHGILRDAAAGVPDDGWQLSSPCAEWTVGQVMHHAAMDQRLYASSITGAGKPEGDAFQPSGELGDARLEYLERALDASVDAFASVPADAEAVSVPLPPFTVPLRTAVGAAALDAAVHGWDIAVATGQVVSFSDALTRELLDVAQALVEPLRAWGAYAPAIEPPADADDLARLLLFLGRRPDWSR